MKKSFIIFALLALLFTGCEQPTEEGGLTVEDIENGAMAASLTGFSSFEPYEEYTTNGEVAAETVYPELAITVGASTVTFVFTDAGFDFDDPADGDDLIVDGTFVVSDSGATFTFTDYVLTNPQTPTETMTINGSFTISGTDPMLITSSFTISGSIFSSTLTVETVMSMPAAGEPSYTSATINGTDYLTEFNAALSNMGGN